MTPQERSSVARGLVMMALLVIAFAIWRAQHNHVLGQAWWKPW